MPPQSPHNRGGTHAALTVSNNHHEITTRGKANPVDSLTHIKAIVQSEIHPATWSLIDKALDAAFQAGRKEALEEVQAIMDMKQ